MIIYDYIPPPAADVLGAHSSHNGVQPPGRSGPVPAIDARAASRQQRVQHTG